VTQAPQVSVIIPAYRADATLPMVLAALKPQVGSSVEVLVVESSGGESARELARAHPWLQVIALPQRTLPGAARNLAAQAARGSRLVFLDADAIPALDWLAQLERGAAEGVVAVAGAVHNARPDSVVGTASHVLEFAEWTPRRRRPQLHAASCNLLVERSAFEESGGFCADVWPGEDTILTVSWGRSKRLGYAPGAGVWHLNRTRLPEMLRHQFRLGQAFVAICDRTAFPHARFSHWPFLILAPLLRIAHLARRFVHDRTLLRQSVASSPVIAAGLFAWTAGVAVERARARRPR
jgi:cellulose synthase/poly-beta-1,6-N-acetylglucosamine synthase-like glycosyltransferase